MSSKIKTDSNVAVVPKVVKGESFLAELGATKFEWTIKDFKAFMHIGQTIKSPSFQIDTTDPSNIFAGRSYHLEMEILGNIPNTQLPIFLVNETVGEIVTKVTFESFSPPFSGQKKRSCVNLWLADYPFFPTSSIDSRKHAMTFSLTFSLPDSEINSPKEAYIPNEVVIELKVTLFQPAEKIQSLPSIAAAANRRHPDRQPVVSRARPIPY
jgi:hypothetical protein